MPVPWGKQAEQTLLASLADRAVTLRQLREVGLMLQRLCKARLLTRPDDHKDPSKRSTVVTWFNIDMYDIRDQLIRPAIKYMERERGAKYSWAELVATSAQPPKVMFSHWWGGLFRDFLATAEAVARDRGLSPSDTIWICTFANSQFGENLGPSIEESPFAQAIKASEGGTVLVVDRAGGSLSRIWCALELKLTIDFKKRLEVYTPSGRVGSKQVQSGPLVEQIAGFDVTRCEASRDCDRRHILNYLVDPSMECEGLETDSDGKFVLRDGWQKQLASLEKVPDVQGAPRRLDGSLEYAYEAELFAQRTADFAVINKLVRGKVSATASSLNFHSEGVRRDSVATSASQSSEATGAVSENRPITTEPDLHCVTLGQLRTFIKRVQAVALKVATTGDFPSGFDLQSSSDSVEKWHWENLSLWHAVELVVKPDIISKGKKCPYGVLFKNKPANEGTCNFAQHVIDCPWATSFKSFSEAIEWWVDARQLRDEETLWIDLLCINQLNSTNDVFAFWVETMTEQISHASSVAAVTHGPEAFQRSFCLLNFHLAFETGTALDFCSNTGVLATRTPFPSGAGMLYGTYPLDIASYVFESSSLLADSKMHKSVDKEVRNSVVMRIGDEARFMKRLKRAMAGPVLHAAAAAGNVEKVRQMCADTSFVLNSNRLAGSLGESAMHIAAAAGNVDMLRTLLAQHANPSPEDVHGETPLHYAALVGHAECFWMLLEHGASAEAESIFGETALEVASMNPAAFMGVNTADIFVLMKLLPSLSVCLGSI